MEEVGELFKVLNEAGISLGFGRDACTNIPNPDDTGWRLMFHDERLLSGREDAFNLILEERGLEHQHLHHDHLVDVGSAAEWSLVVVEATDYRAELFPV